MKAIIKWFAILLVIIISALLLFQNHLVLLEKRTFYLFSEDIFGFSYGSLQLPLLAYFICSILAGAFFMAVPAFALWFKNLRLHRRVAALEAELEGPQPPKLDPGDDLAYHIKDDDQFD